MMTFPINMESPNPFHGSSHHQPIDDLGYPHDKTDTPMTNHLSESITDKSDPTDSPRIAFPTKIAAKTWDPVGPVGPQAAACQLGTDL